MRTITPRLTAALAVFTTVNAAGMIACAGLAAYAYADEETLSGVDTWGYRKALPAVVNPTVRSSRQNVVSLRGEWEFITRSDVTPLRHPNWQAYYAKP